MTFKLILFIPLLLLSLTSECQIWQYPYKIIGQPYNNEVMHKIPSKVIIVDSSINGVKRTYKEYDSRGNLKKEKFMWLERDTTFYFYNDKNQETMRVRAKGDTVHNIYKTASDGRITKKLVVNNNDTLIIDYDYNTDENTLKVFCDSILCELIKYKEGKIHSVQSYSHDNDGLSSVITYSYEGDTISYTECPYDTDGNRYDWPCEKTVGILDENKKVQKIKSVYYDTAQGEYVEAFSITEFFYDSKGRFVSMKDKLSTGSSSEIIQLYDEAGYKVKVELKNNGELVREFDYIILNK
jgi:hypothetical protein